MPSACRTLRRRLKKDAKLWIRFQATVPVTRKPEGIRMGKGKGAIAFYASPVSLDLGSCSCPLRVRPTLVLKAAQQWPSFAPL